MLFYWRWSGFAAGGGGRGGSAGDSGGAGGRHGYVEREGKEEEVEWRSQSEHETQSVKKRELKWTGEKKVSHFR